MKHDVGSCLDLEPGQMKEVLIGHVSVALIRIADGSYRALRNRCPHQGARLSAGKVEPRIDATQPGEICFAADAIRCPWHGYEFDLTNGRSLSDPNLKVRAYPVAVEEGRVIVER